MQYRLAKNLQPGDIVINKKSKEELAIFDITIFGQYKKVKIHAFVLPHIPGKPDKKVYLFNDDVELKK